MCLVKLVVLNCLDIQPMSTYDIKVFLEKIDAMRWSGILIGSIQNAMNTLERDGCIQVSSVENTGKRRKVIYCLTERGSALQKDLVVKSLSSSDLQFSSVFFTGLSNLSKFDKEEILELLEKRKESLSIEYESILEGKRKKQQAVDNIAPIEELVFQNMLDTISLQIKLTKDIIHELGNIKEGNNEN